MESKGIAAWGARLGQDGGDPNNQAGSLIAGLMALNPAPYGLFRRGVRCAASC